MSDKIIRKLVETRIANWAATYGIDVIYENSIADKDYPYLVLHINPADTLSLDLAGEHRLFMGLINIEIIDKLDVGSAQTDAIVEELAALFPLNLIMTDVSGLNVAVYKPISKGSSDSSNNEFSTPVRCAYRCDTI